MTNAKAVQTTYQVTVPEDKNAIWVLWHFAKEYRFVDVDDKKIKWTGKWAMSKAKFVDNDYANLTDRYEAQNTLFGKSN